MDIAVADGGSCTEFGMHRHARVARRGRRRVDLSGADFVDPLGLVVVAAVVGREEEEGREVTFVAPRDRAVGGYLYRMGLGDVLDAAGVGHNLPAVRSHPTRDRLVELTRFTDQSEADRLGERVNRIFRREDPAVAHALSASVEEITTNVLEHSDRSCGYLALQQYCVDGRQQVAFAVGDHGIGLRERLSRTFECPDDETAIDLAVRRRVSSEGPDAGLGIHSVARIAHERGGAVRLWSGGALGVVRSPGRPSSKFRPGGQLHGTVVHARMRVS